MQRNRSSRPAAGFTLVEVMVAAAVMVATIVGMIQVVVSGSQMLDLARKQTVATQILQHEIGKLHIADWTTISGYSTASTGTVLPIDTAFQDALDGWQFSCTRVVENITTGVNPKKKVTFTVTWQTAKVGQAARTYTRSSSTYVTLNGLYVSYRRS
jgi:Tfp pilus assembly protein PilV